MIPLSTSSEQSYSSSNGSSPKTDVNGETLPSLLTQFHQETSSDAEVRRLLQRASDQSGRDQILVESLDPELGVQYANLLQRVECISSRLLRLFLI